MNGNQKIEFMINQSDDDEEKDVDKNKEEKKEVVKEKLYWMVICSHHTVNPTQQTYIIKANVSMSDALKRMNDDFPDGSLHQCTMEGTVEERFERMIKEKYYFCCEYVKNGKRARYTLYNELPLCIGDMEIRIE